MMVMVYLFYAAILALVTIIIETPIMLIFYSKIKNLKRIIYSSIIINLMTNAVLNCMALPFVFFLTELMDLSSYIYSFFNDLTLAISVAILEVVIMAVENSCYLATFKMKDADKKDKRKLKALVIAANTISYFFGLYFYNFILINF